MVVIVTMQTRFYYHFIFIFILFLFYHFRDQGKYTLHSTEFEVVRAKDSSVSRERGLLNPPSDNVVGSKKL